MQHLPRGMAGIAGILGHELRNPLTAIAALARVTMSRDDLPADVRERLAQMDHAAQRSLAMVQSLLDFSESDWRGTLPTRPVLAEPAEIAGRIVDELRATIPTASSCSTCAPSSRSSWTRRASSRCCRT